MADQPKFSFVKWSTLYVLIGFNVTFFVINAFIFYKFYVYQPPRPSLLNALMQRPPEPQLVEYKDFISIVLSALSIMVTALGIGLAVIAIWGYGQIKDGATRAAEEIARTATVEAAVRLERDRQSTTAAQERYAKLAGLSPETVQKMAEALFSGNESGTNEPSAPIVGPQDAPDP